MARVLQVSSVDDRRVCRRLPGSRVGRAPSHMLLLFVVLLASAGLPVGALGGQASQDSQLDAPVQTAGHASQQITQACLTPSPADYATVQIRAASANGTIAGHVIPDILARKAVKKGRMPGDFTLHVELVFKLRNPDQFSECLASITDPSSPDYAHFLDATTLAPYMPTPGQRSSIVSHLSRMGLNVTEGASPLVLRLSGPVRAIEKAFGVTIDLYAEKATAGFYAADSDPMMPQNFASVVNGIMGLDNSTRPIRAEHPCSGPYCPQGIQVGYSLSSLLGNGYDGTGQKVAIVDVPGDANIQSTINTYSTMYGLPSTTLDIRYPDGVPSSYDPGWAVETALDVEAVHAVAPGATIVLLYDQVDPMNAIDYVATYHLATIVSNSWSYACVSGRCSDTQLSSSWVSSVHTRLAVDAAQGLTILFASGDNGAKPDGAVWGTEFPASDPNVLAVGGTNLALSGCGYYTCSGYVSETGASISGGGYSGYFAEPSWQTSTIGARSGRAVPDISMIGQSPSFWTYLTGSGWFGVYGTSLSTPLWAGFLAIVLQMKGGGSFGNLGPGLYQIASSSSYSSIFHDIASGSNGYSAGPGWDPVTGWGTPRADLLAYALAGLHIALVVPANGATVTTSPVTFQVRVTDFAGAPVQGADVVVYVNHPYLYITYFCASSDKSDSNGYFSCDITLTDTGTNYRWYATASKSGYRSATSQTGTFNYFVQVTMTVSYSVPGAGTGYSDPVFNYVHGGQSNTYTLTATSTDISVDSGSAWSVTPNPLAGSTPSERWYSSQTLSGTASTTAIIFTYYHQYLQTLSYAVSGGGSGYSASIFTANRYGVSAPQTLTSTATGYWYDAGSSWSVTPNPLSGSGASERWITTQTITGTISSAQTITFTYQHQYYLTTQVNPSGGGSASATSGWQNAGITVPITATPNTDYVFYYWNLDGTNVGTTPSYSLLMNSAHTLTAMFRSTSSISVSLSVAPDGFAWIISGTITPTQPSPGISTGTPVTLSYSSDGGGTWSNFITVLTSSGGDYSVYWQQPYQYTDFRVRASWNGNAAYEGSSSSFQTVSGTYGPFYPPVNVLVSGSGSVARGGLATFDVLVTCPSSYTIDRTLYIMVVGPDGYQYFDTVRAAVNAGETKRYQFVWQAPSTLAAGTYQVYVGLIPPNPTAYDQAQIAVT